jgi:hypothetical protein
MSWQECVWRSTNKGTDRLSGFNWRKSSRVSCRTPHQPKHITHSNNHSIKQSTHQPNNESPDIGSLHQTAPQFINTFLMFSAWDDTSNGLKQHVAQNWTPMLMLMLMDPSHGLKNDSCLDADEDMWITPISKNNLILGSCTHTSNGFTRIIKASRNIARGVGGIQSPGFQGTTRLRHRTRASS